MNNILKKYFSKPKEDLNNQKNSSEILSENKNNFSKKTGEIITDVATNSFYNIFPEFQEISWNTNSHLLIAKNLSKNLKKDDLKKILENNLVSASIKIYLISEITKNGDFKEIFTKDLFEKMQTEYFIFEEKNKVKILFSKHYKKGIYLFPNFKTKIWKLLETKKENWKIIFYFDDKTKFYENWTEIKN